MELMFAKVFQSRIEILAKVILILIGMPSFHVLKYWNKTVVMNKGVPISSKVCKKLQEIHNIWLSIENPNNVGGLIFAKFKSTT